MTDFLSRLKSTVTALQQDPQVEVFHFAIAPPSAGLIELVETVLGHALHPAIVDFYTACDGVQLLWIRKDSPEYAKYQRFISEFRFEGYLHKPWFPTWNGGEMDFTPDGTIWMPGVRDVFFMDLATEYGYSFARADFHPELTRDYADFSVHPVDFCHYSSQVCMLLNGTPNPYLMRSVDHMAGLEGPAISFADYLEVLLLCRGAVKPRLAKNFLGQYVPSDVLKIIGKDDFVIV